jgi:hypothetical protein
MTFTLLLYAMADAIVTSSTAKAILVFLSVQILNTIAVYSSFDQLIHGR